MIGTLHSHAFRAIGHPTVALDPKVVGDWNEQVVPEWALTPSSRQGGGNVSESGSFAADPALARTGDELLGAMGRLRAALVPPEDWPTNVREFAEKYSAWKHEVGAIDFEDMITDAYWRARDGERPPGGPSRFVVDEAQDMTPLEIALVLEWGKSESIERLVIGMDDDQAINRWRGGDPEPLLNLHGPNVVDHVLDQSWRVPESVRQIAECWVRNLTHRRDKVYRPRLDDAGNAVVGAAYRVPLRLNSQDLVAAALTEADAGRTVMIIAACNYMLEPLVANLRAEGVPFHNPFRPSEGRWNPLGKRGEGITSTSERVRRYLLLAEHDWTGSDIQSWSELIKLKDAGMRVGARKAIAAFSPNAVVPWEELAALFGDPEQLERAVQPDLDWLAGCLLKDKQKVAEYPIQIARRHGAAALDVEPKIVVGTIHCSPPDEPVLTTRGYVPIGELDPATHDLVGYNTSSGLVRGTKQPGSFVRAVNQYSGRLFTITTERSRTRVTPDHRMRVAFADSFFGKWVVYLMRRGDWWRVGHCVSGRRPYRSGGIGGRLATEQADAGWILGVYTTKREAVLAEALAQAEFGIPGLTFEAASGREVTSADLHMVHDAVANEVSIRAKSLLDAFGLSEDAPLYGRNSRKLNRSDMRATFLTEARNLAVFADHLLLPVIPEDFATSTGKRWPELLSASLEVEHYHGDVHSLEVLPHHHYVSGGAVVHNSVKGAAADIVYVSPDVSAAAARSMVPSLGRAGFDEAIRQFYVAMTRAYQELRLLAPTSPNHLKPDQLIPSTLEVFPS
jgi:DNA helicase-2/ATP-dependent DNA helicase PcrA